MGNLSSKKSHPGPSLQKKISRHGSTPMVPNTKSPRPSHQLTRLLLPPRSKPKKPTVKPSAPALLPSKSQADIHPPRPSSSSSTKAPVSSTPTGSTSTPSTSQTTPTRSHPQTP